MTTMYAMCGLAFSGKSTVARRLATLADAALVSLDEINDERGLHGGEGMTDRQWEQTSMMAIARLRLFMERNVNVAVDDTNSHRFLRDRYRALAADYRYDFVLVYVDTDLAEIGRRRAENERTGARGRITQAVFEHHRARFQHPSDDERPVRLHSPAEVEAWLAAVRPS